MTDVIVNLVITQEVTEATISEVTLQFSMLFQQVGALPQSKPHWRFEKLILSQRMLATTPVWCRWSLYMHMEGKQTLSTMHSDWMGIQEGADKIASCTNNSLEPACMQVMIMLHASIVPAPCAQPIHPVFLGIFPFDIGTSTVLTTVEVHLFHMRGHSFHQEPITVDTVQALAQKHIALFSLN